MAAYGIQNSANNYPETLIALNKACTLSTAPEVGYARVSFSPAKRIWASCSGRYPTARSTCTSKCDSSIYCQRVGEARNLIRRQALSSGD